MGEIETVSRRMLIERLADLRPLIERAEQSLREAASYGQQGFWEVLIDPERGRESLKTVRLLRTQLARWLDDYARVGR